MHTKTHNLSHGLSQLYDGFQLETIKTVSLSFYPRLGGDDAGMEINLQILHNIKKSSINVVLKANTLESYALDTACRK